MQRSSKPTSFLAVQEAQLMQAASGAVYCQIKSGTFAERTGHIKSEGNLTCLMFNELIELIIESTTLNVGIYEITNGFSDTLIGECTFDISDPSDTNRYELRCYNAKEKVTETVGDIGLSLENTEYSKGKTFRKARDFVNSASNEDLQNFNISDKKSSNSVAKVIKEILKENATTADLSGLRLSKCPPEMSQIAVTTKILDMGFNEFTKFPDVSFMGFQYLQEFILTGNKLSTLPPTVSQLCNLTSFYLNGNVLKSLPPEIGKLTLLEKLDLSNNQLERVLPEIGYLTNLQDLLLSGNPITELPRSIGRCVNMEVMDVSSCQLSSVPNEFVRMTSLMELNLGNNQLKSLPSNIGRMTRLVSLNLSDNSLNDLPLSIGYCQGIMQFYVDRNPIQDRKIIEKSKMGADHLVDYLETRMLSYMADRGINPNAMQNQMEKQQQDEVNAKIRQQQLEEEQREQERLEEEERIQAVVEQQKQQLLQSSTPQEQAIIAKLNQAKHMGIAIFSDCLNRVANLEMFVGQVTNIRAGLPFARSIEGLSVDLETLQRVIGYQREPSVPRISVGFASPQLQNFKHTLLIKLAHATVCITAAAPFLQECDDAQTIVNIVKTARSMNFKLTNVM